MNNQITNTYPRALGVILWLLQTLPPAVLFRRARIGDTAVLIGLVGKTMGKPWENHGKTMGKPWENL